HLGLRKAAAGALSRGQREKGHPRKPPGFPARLPGERPLRRAAPGLAGNSLRQRGGAPAGGGNPPGGAGGCGASAGKNLRGETPMDEQDRKRSVVQKTVWKGVSFGSVLAMVISYCNW